MRAVIGASTSEFPDSSNFVEHIFLDSLQSRRETMIHARNNKSSSYYSEINVM